MSIWKRNYDRDIPANWYVREAGPSNERGHVPEKRVTQDVEHAGLQHGDSKQKSEFFLATNSQCEGSEKASILDWKIQCHLYTYSYHSLGKKKADLENLNKFLHQKQTLWTNTILVVFS